MVDWVRFDLGVGALVFAYDIHSFEFFSVTHTMKEFSDPHCKMYHNSTTRVSHRTLAK
jgi:hypothetical protein